ncbi:hypothetical protein MMC20_007873 [Loxospora ochrophaea]|nr:hypothetical protein [Loxospora ochrophaea]
MPSLFHRKSNTCKSETPPRPPTAKPTITIKDIVLRFYAAEKTYLARGSTPADFSLLTPILSPSLVLYSSRELPWGGRYDGHLGFRDWIRKTNIYFDQREVQNPKFFTAEGNDKVNVWLKFVARIRTTRKVLEKPMLQLVAVDRGMIVTIRIFYWGVTEYRRELGLPREVEEEPESKVKPPRDKEQDRGQRAAALRGLIATQRYWTEELNIKTAELNRLNEEYQREVERARKSGMNRRIILGPLY